MRDDIEVLARIEAYMRRRTARKAWRPPPRSVTATVFPLKSRIERIRSAANQLDATGMEPGQDYNWIFLLNLADQWAAKVCHEVHFAGGQRTFRPREVFDILHVGESLCTSMSLRLHREARGRGYASDTASLILVVSGGGSAASELACNPSRAPVPASAAVLRNSRRLQPSRFWILDFWIFDCRIKA